MTTTIIDYTEPRRVDWELEYRDAQARITRLDFALDVTARELARLPRSPKGDRWSKGELRRMFALIDRVERLIERSRLRG